MILKVIYTIKGGTERKKKKTLKAIEGEKVPRLKTGHTLSKEWLLP